MTVHPPENPPGERTEVLPWGDLQPRLDRALRGDGGMPERHPDAPTLRVADARWTGRCVIDGDGFLRCRDAVLTLTYASAGEG